MHQNGWHAAAVYTVVVLAAAADFEVVIVDTALHALNVVLDIRAGELRILTRRFLQGQPARPCQLHTPAHAHQLTRATYLATAPPRVSEYVQIGRPERQPSTAVVRHGTCFSGDSRAYVAIPAAWVARTNQATQLQPPSSHNTPAHVQRLVEG